MDENAEEWLATDDPTEGDLPTTEFIGSAKDLSQSVDPAEGDGSEIPEVQEPGDSEGPILDSDAGEESADDADAEDTDAESAE